MNGFFGNFFSNGTTCVQVAQIVAGSAAEKAGLKTGDLILKVDDTAVQSLDQYRAAIAQARKAKQKFVVLTVERMDEDGKKMTDVEDVPLQ